VGRSNIGRPYSSPLRIEPETGKVSEDSLESQPNVAWDVLQDDEAWSYLANDSMDFGPEVPLVVFSFPLSCDREGLAGIARSDEIHSSTPGPTVESSQIRPYRRLIQPPFFHARSKDFAAIGFPLHETDCARAGKGQLDSEIEPSDSGAEAEYPGTTIHTLSPPHPPTP
jgi:hypothetical protein